MVWVLLIEVCPWRIGCADAADCWDVQVLEQFCQNAVTVKAVGMYRVAWHRLLAASSSLHSCASPASCKSQITSVAEHRIDTVPSPNFLVGEPHHQTLCEVQEGLWN